MHSHQSLKHSHFYTPLLWCALFYIYSLLRDLFPILPPMIGVLFLVYARVHERFLLCIGVFVCLFSFESMHMQTLGILTLLFIVYHQIFYKNSLRFLNNSFIFKSWHIFAIYFLYLSHFFFDIPNWNTLYPFVIFALIESALWSSYEKLAL
ncbi:hypothetical protein [Helicobacter cetorum]|uniref:Rod shape-determining protein MreD n=1 Tax=Helicobacter cetorum (strain ATCC BAA-429 / MIT 00-7128) TaxID=182217 RepID=I0EKB0_HELC0|nr:hypothetical protein HCW_00420 [Helicobacter cetorum MIT 00-7128]